VSELNVETADIATAWRATRLAVLTALHAKQAAPLEPIADLEMIRTAHAFFIMKCDSIRGLNERLKQANTAIKIVKEHAAADDPAALRAELARLRAIKSRQDSEIAASCEAYVMAKAAKALIEKQRDEKKAALQRYRETVFPAYQAAVNTYLLRFNADFRLADVHATDNRGGPTCTYCLVINDTSIPIAGTANSGVSPTFRTALSSGDRNTLALAFFFASLDEASLADKIVVIDDPITSLDEHRSLTTVQEISSISERTRQVIVLSHNKPFLCRIWEKANDARRAALQLTRVGSGSTIGEWNAREDSFTEHDRRHALLKSYLERQTANQREVARAIRPLLEAFFRVAYPAQFPPGTLLGWFRDRCEQYLSSGHAILNRDDTRELAEIVEYANRFHHDSSHSLETEFISDAELTGFVNRALAFTCRP
jgi:wobble nucleotide-excising tRNase